MRRLSACLALVAFISLAEWKVLERLQYAPGPNLQFVLVNVHGVLAGTPVSKSWQQRFLAPLLVSALERVTHDPLASLKLFAGVMLLAANLLLFALMRRRGATLLESLLAVVCFGFARLLLAYRLEYPWDGIDVLLFLTFGYWAARDGALLPLAPLLLIGVFNHETVLYIPLWYLLSTDKKQIAIALAGAIVLGGITLLMRNHFYRGQPDLPGQVFEPLTPVIDNHLHVGHNLGQIFAANWIEGRAHLSLGILGAVALLIRLAVAPATRQAAIWSLCVIASIVCFGYTNETRHYLPLLAFWCLQRHPSA